MPNFSPRLAWVMLIARRPSRIRAPIYWSTALEALGDFVFRFAFFIWPLALDQLEVAIAFGGDVVRDVGVEHRGLLHQCPVLRGKLARQAGARRDGEPQRRVLPAIHRGTVAYPVLTEPNLQFLFSAKTLGK